MGSHLSRSFCPISEKKSTLWKSKKIYWGLLRELAEQRGSEIVEGHLVQDHCHMMIKIPPKHSISEVIGYIKGKTAIAVARQFSGRQRNFNGEKLCAATAMPAQQSDLTKNRFAIISSIKISLIRKGVMKMVNFR